MLTQRQELRCWRPFLLGIGLLFVGMFLPVKLAAQDIAEARKLFTQCKEELDAGKACKAEKTCKKGLAAAELKPLKKLYSEAKSKCKKPSSRKRDRDKDGIPDKADKCRKEAEDLDGFEDEDGCPDPDNDADGVLDADDACPLVAEDRDGVNDDDGCPDLDEDADGVDDSVDGCLTAREDRDGFEDDDGCPDPDNDGDGVLDELDACPLDAEDRDGFEDENGCPDPDNDKDGIADTADSCPLEAGLAEDQGCPSSGVGWILIGSGGGLAIVGGALLGTGLFLESEVMAYESQGLVDVRQTDAQSDADLARALNISGQAALYVGTGILVGGVVVMLLTGSSSSETSFYLSPQPTGLVLGGSF